MASKTYVHLSFEDRREIESFLNSNSSLKTITASLNRDPKTIRNEILKHRSLSVRTNKRNKCGKQLICSITRLCDDCANGHCALCGHTACNELCPEFNPFPNCCKTTRFPYVCNGCEQKKDCKLPKVFYDHTPAHSAYSQAVSDSKCGFRKSDSEMAVITKAVQEGVKNGLSLEVIIQKYHLNIALSTLYSYIESNIIPGITNLDLKRKVRYRPRKHHVPRIIKRNYEYLKNRTYNDFLECISNTPNINVWEMDTIIGKHGKTEKCALSLLYRKTNLQLYFILNSCTSKEVIRIFDGIRSYLGADLFKQTFPIILTDNGSEFIEPLLIEIDPDTGEQLCSVYYCDPRHSEEKGKCEKNHEHFREMVPKGKSMNSLTKIDMRYISNMVNNYPRKILNFHSPYEISQFFLNEKVFRLNRLTYLPHTKVCLNTIIK